MWKTLGLWAGQVGWMLEAELLGHPSKSLEDSSAGGSGGCGTLGVGLSAFLHYDMAMRYGHISIWRGSGVDWFE